jgi:DNA invertase Pin-like site-specific DNA recombinase
MVTSDSVIGYVRVSTGEQAHNGYGLAAQRDAIEGECVRRSWQLLRIEEDAASGKTTKKRPGLARAIAACDGGQASALVAAKADRLSRSVIDFANLLGHAQKSGWNLCVLDLGIDLATPMGEAMANMAMVFAQLERRLIGQRTSAGLAVARAQGVRIGRPRSLPKQTVRRIVRDRDAGLSLRAIADRLNARRIPRAQGGAYWYASTVAAVLRSDSLDTAA